MVQVLQLLEALVLVEVSLIVASLVIHQPAHTLTHHRLLPLSSPPSNHSRVLPLKREPPEPRRPTSLSPRLGTAPPLTLAPPTLLTCPPPAQRTQRTPLAHHHSLKTHFVARERLEQLRTHHMGEVEVELMKSQKEVIPMSFCLGSEAALDRTGRPTHHSLVPLLPTLARREVVTPAAGVEPVLVPAGGMVDNHNIRRVELVLVVLLHSLFMGLVILTHWRLGYRRL